MIIISRDEIYVMKVLKYSKFVLVIYGPFTCKLGFDCFAIESRNDARSVELIYNGLHWVEETDSGSISHDIPITDMNNKWITIHEITRYINNIGRMR
jgi:hypothetical protein